MMKVDGNTLVNTTENIVCWNGQDGGLEGLRQKGWSIGNLLVIRRESMNRNTKTTILAQGDNQVICGKYKLQKVRTQAELEGAINGIVQENHRIMTAIEVGTRKLGLIINRDETLQSADYLVYGKVPIYRGSMRGLETKRWSRVTCVTNDQLPTLANVMSSISSNALTVAHFANSPLNAISHYNFLGNFGRRILGIHNPALKGQARNKIKDPNRLNDREYKALVLYLDPCLGGVCGMSLTRFLIRAFPDPITESLVFWKCLYNNGEQWVKDLAVQVGNPIYGQRNLAAFSKLLEDPVAINIPGGVNPMTLIKETIKQSLIEKSGEIKNNIMRDAIRHLHANEGPLIDYLRSIKPLFPRFLSEYLSGTYVGIVRSLVNLFQNSKTIRTIFSRKIDKKIKGLIVLSETQAIESLMSVRKRSKCTPIWKCSSSKADRMRQESWGEPVLGATVPHPMELLGSPIRQGPPCYPCCLEPPSTYYVSVLVPMGLTDYRTERGPYKAYLGSKTSETTSVLRPWEREAKVPLIKRAAKLRQAIGWFVEENSKLGFSITQNLEALTGESWENKTEGAKRTGSALHRFSCARQSSAGYAACSPAKLTWVCMTTDTLSTLNSVNHDFMHQSLLIYAQATVIEIMDGVKEQGYFHCHIGCVECLREIENVKLETERDFTHQDVSATLEKWKPEGTGWSTECHITGILEGNWGILNPFEQSYHLGRACGFLYGDMKMSGDSRCDDVSIFPLSLQNKVIPRAYLDGVLEGMIRASAIHCIYRRAISDLKRPREALLGTGLHLINEVSNTPGLITMWRSEGFERLFNEVPHKIPPSYPMSNTDLGHLGKAYLRMTYLRRYVESTEDMIRYPNIWIFADINDKRTVGMLSLSTKLMSVLYKNNLNKYAKNLIRGTKDLITALRDPEGSERNVYFPKKNLWRLDEEVRHASKAVIKQKSLGRVKQYKWGRELEVPFMSVDIPYVATGQVIEEDYDDVDIPRVQNPLISGLRCFQFATGSHYKIQSIIGGMRIRFRDAIGGGDGSGGICSYLLRAAPSSRVIFNSLLRLDDVDLRGSTPSPPSAITALGTSSTRCVNLKTAWENPSDLSEERTWEYFLSLKEEYQLFIDLIILDMECNSDTTSDKIEHCLAKYVFQLLSRNGTLIYKTFLDRIINQGSTLLNQVGVQFKSIQTVVTDMTSSQSSEIYVVMRRKNETTILISPDISVVVNNLREYPCMRPLEREFERAKFIAVQDLYKGVPRELLTDPVDDLSILAETLNVEEGVTAILEETLKLDRNNPRSETPFLYLFVCLQSLLRLNVGWTTKPNPPSDSRVYNTGSLIIGFMNWLSLATDNLELHKSAQSMINDCFSLSWRHKRVPIGKKTGKGKSNSESETKLGYIVVYSFMGKYDNKKNFHMDSNMAKIGQVQRCLFRVFGLRRIDVDPADLNEMLKIFNKSLSLKSIRHSTDLDELLLSGQEFQNKEATASWEPADMGESGWTN